MKKLIAAATLAALIATPALARPHAAVGAHGPLNAYGQVYQPDGRAPVAQRGSDAVIVNGHYIGRDPDPNVRLELRRGADIT